MSRFFINRPIVAIVISILTVIVGLVSLLGLPVAQYGMAQDLDSGGQDGSTAAEAMKWYLLAASGGVREAAAAADRLEAASGPAIAGEARARAAEWRRSHPARQRQP